MKNPFDARVLSLSKTGLEKITRPIEFTPRITMSEGANRRQFFVGDLVYKIHPGEKASILFLAAIEYEDWIFTLERLRERSSVIMIGGFHKGETHCNFGPIPNRTNAAEELFDFFLRKNTGRIKVI